MALQHPGHEATDALVRAQSEQAPPAGPGAEPAEGRATSRAAPSEDAPWVTVIVATRDRSSLLESALLSLAAACDRAPFRVEVIVVDNGSRDATPAVLERIAAGREGWRVLTFPTPGKARALNHGLGYARAELLAFTDDDVVVDGGWLTSLAAFFAEHPEYDAAVGRVVADPEGATAEACELIDRYRTLPLYENGAAVVDDVHLYGCNMGIRKRALERVGPFDGRLGPGASGLHEDGEMASRILGAGMRIGYMPECVIQHAVEPDRLCDDFCLEMHRRDGRSRFVIDAPRGCRRAVVRFAGTTLILGFWTLFGRRCESMRARARAISHREYLRVYFEARRSGAEQDPGTPPAAPATEPQATATE